MRRHSYSALLIALVVLACSDPSGPGHPGLSVVSGANVLDTIDAVLGAPLVVVLRDSHGDPMPNTTVTFQGDGCPAACRTLLIPSGQPGSPASGALSTTTDHSGEARVLVQMGPTVGLTHVAVSAGGQDSLRAAFRVLHGNATTLGATPHDGGGYVSRTIQLHFAPVDRYGNPAGLLVNTTSLDTAIATVTGAGVVTTRAYGVARIEARGGTLVDTLTVTVVPTFRVAINLLNGQVAVMGLDGTVETTYNSGGLVESVDWIPGMATLVYSRTSPDGRIFTSGGLRVTKTDTVATAECYADVSADGSTLYFSAFPQGSVHLTIFRVNLNGTGLAMTAAGPDVYEPDVAPDNDRIAFAPSNHGSFCGIAVLTQSNGNLTCLHQPGILPRWSPDGSRIAWLSSEVTADLMLMNPDGTGVTRLSDGIHTYTEGGPNWSPDGEWIVVTDFSLHVELYRVSDGLRLPLRWLPRAGWIVFER